MKKLIATIALLAGALTAQNGPLANGVYAVEQMASKAAKPVQRTHDGKTLVLDAANFAPLAIQGKPEVHRSPQGSWLEVQLTPEAAKKLASLTQSHLNHPIAIVVGDHILSAPTVRSPITDGKARLTPCADESCEALIRALTR